MPFAGRDFGYMLDTLLPTRSTAISSNSAHEPARRVSLPRLAISQHVETLMLARGRIPRIASRHTNDIPGGLRALVAVIGGRDRRVTSSRSYLTFETGYTPGPDRLGYRDAMEARAAIMAFMSGEKLPPPPGSDVAWCAQAT